MHSFTDTLGRTWGLALTIGDVKRIRGSELKVDLLRINEGKPSLLTRIGTDVELMIDLVWMLVDEQAQELGLSPMDFVKGLGGDAATAANDAFYAELIDFFLQLRRTHEARAVEKQRIAINLAIERATKRIEALTSEQLLGEGSDPWRIIYQLAGRVGLDPSPLTVRELVNMVEGQSIGQWWHTAAVLSLLANQHRDRKKRPKPYTPKEFHPHFAHQVKRGIPLTRDNIRLLKQVFCRDKKPR